MDNDVVFVIKESGVGGSTRKANKNLRSRIQQLEEENNLLKLKYEILLNMVGGFKCNAILIDFLVLVNAVYC